MQEGDGGEAGLLDHAAGIVLGPHPQPAVQLLVGWRVWVDMRAYVEHETAARPQHPSVLSVAERSVNANPELNASYTPATEAGWVENVLQQ